MTKITRVEVAPAIFKWQTEHGHNVMVMPATEHYFIDLRGVEYVIHLTDPAKLNPVPHSSPHTRIRIKDMDIKSVLAYTPSGNSASLTEDGEWNSVEVTELEILPEQYPLFLVLVDNPCDRSLYNMVDYFNEELHKAA